VIEALFGGAFGAMLAEAARAKSVGGAFIGGYRAALKALVPSLPAGNVCLCATEEGGAHPRAIQSTWKEAGGGWQLDGRKHWVTGGDQADYFLVVASTGTDDAGRNRLKLGLVGARQPGVSTEPMPPTPFVPEIAHVQVTFEAVFAEELLEGDGYERYLKPFRTVEDAHVFAAVLAYTLPRAPHAAAEKILAVLAALEKVVVSDPTSRELHLVLAGALALGKQLAAEMEVDESWKRDLALLNVAQKARDARTAAAWATAGSKPPPA
jgi:alkylation response protein AidB-like acyl-CoA dehydrogenase